MTPERKAELRRTVADYNALAHREQCDVADFAWVCRTALPEALDAVDEAEKERDEARRIANEPCGCDPAPGLRAMLDSGMDRMLVRALVAEKERDHLRDVLRKVLGIVTETRDGGIPCCTIADHIALYGGPDLRAEAAAACKEDA